MRSGSGGDFGNLPEVDSEIRRCANRASRFELVRLFVGRSVSWLIGWLDDWSVGRLFGVLVG